MNVLVTEVIQEPGETVLRGKGRDEETGEVVIFAGDWRPMMTLDEALREEGAVEAWIEPWQVLARLPGDPEAN